MVLGLAERSRQWIVFALMRVRYTGCSKVRIIPLSLSARKYWPFYDRGHSPVCQSILDVIQCRVNEDSAVIPSTTLDSNGLVNGASLAQSLVRESDGYSTHRLSTITHIRH